MFYLCRAGLAEHYRNNIKTKGAVLDIVGCEKIASSPKQSGFFSGCDRRFGWCETFIGSGSDLDKDNGPIGIDHNKVDFTGLAGEVASELFEPLSYKVSFAAFFPPSAEEFSVS